ncbi:ATP-binding protein [Saccharopolyspora sp. K220]|uniref:ATP-binding protein n=1 Tax=Saccharopolyspora soli TaxID=2926618 RepID=UPI001F586B10|nr:ATP-binding protein [Saccharopolyspora soli]MCI2424330.1 ATP-binding protein [Saccharopolyspora soli]
MGRREVLDPADDTDDWSALAGAGKWAKDKIKQARVRRHARRRAWGPRELHIRAWQKSVVTPPVTSALTWGTGQCAHLLALQADTSMFGAAALAGFTVGGAAFVVRVAGKKVFVKRWESLYWTTAGTITAWITIATITGATWTLTALLALAMIVLARPWWHAHPTPAPAQLELPSGAAELPALEAAPATQETDHIVDEILDRWYTFIDKPGRLDGSVLTEHVELPHGQRFDVHLDRDRHTIKDVLDLKPRIAAVMGPLGMSIDDILIEQHTANGVTDHGKATITFTTTNPLKDGVPYQGPRYDNGWIAVGPWRDGQGWGSIRLADHNASVFNGLVTGDPGTGKSVFLENLGMSALASGCWKVFYTDGSEDADSSSLLNDHMTWSQAGIEGAWRSLAAVKDYLAYRGVENNALPADIRGVNPSPERMGLLWIIDELHRLAAADPAFALELAQVVRLGRKKGVAVWGATQGVDLKEDFGGVTALRDILTSRNVVAFYSSSTYAHTMISGAKIAPNTLPNDGGYAYLKTPGMMRAAMLRTDYSQDMTPWARQIPEYPWDEGGWLSVRKHLEAHNTDQEEKREEAQRRLQAMRIRLQHGLDIDHDDATRPSKNNPGSGPLAALFALIPTPAFADETTATSSTANDDERDELDRLHHAILGLVREGVTATGDIVDRMRARDVAERTTKRKLAELLDRGHLERGIKQGVYQIPAA